MSNWRTAKLNTLNNVEEPFLSQALDAMGYYANPDDHVVNGSYSFDGNRQADVVLYTKNGEKANIGFVFHSQEDGTVSMDIVCDWYNKGSYKDFEDKFTVEYNTAKFRDVAARNNFVVENEVDQINGGRRMVLRKAA